MRTNIALILLWLVGHVTFLSAQVRQEWVARYDGPGTGEDSATALALDAAGNVYVTGWSRGLGTGLDYATLKYDPDGNLVWVARYDGPGRGEDKAVALAVDAGGNVYVTGWSMGLDTGMDYATLKYDPNGNPLWVARYDGPGRGFDGDRPVALELDTTGNVCVTGKSIGLDTGLDYATVKYDPDGNPLWVARYDGPGNLNDAAAALAVDEGGNVYITGESCGAGLPMGRCMDFATIKYDPEGNPAWVARYDGPGNGYDAGRALALDVDGNVYVTGSSLGAGPILHSDYATIKYGPDGNPLWVARYQWEVLEIPRALALDTDGNVYVTGSSYTGPYDYATVKYDPAGNQVWVARYHRVEIGASHPNALAIDTAGNVYVTGESYGGYRYGHDYTTIKYDPAGHPAWVAHYKGPEPGPDDATAIAVDAAGNVYVTGYSLGRGTGYDYATIKYSQN